VDLGIQYVERVTPLGTEEWRQMQAVTGSSSLPRIVINDVSIGGYADLINLEASGELYRRLNMVGGTPRTSLYDTIIMGAGPAGLSAAIYTARKMMKTMVISQNIGGHVANYYDLENVSGFSRVTRRNWSASSRIMSKLQVETDIGDEVQCR
jgi:alkyl hydroperoxide reductase subunit F